MALGSKRFFAKAVLVSVLVVIPWTIRNFQVMGRFVPIKSNLAFEAYQAQCVSPNGLVNTFSMGSHPIRNLEVRDRYAAIGEAAFLAEAREAFLADLLSRPFVWFQKVLNRVESAFFRFTDLGNTSGPLWSFLGYQVLHWFPTACILRTILLWRTQTEIARSAAILWLAFLLPYLLVSYYNRYSVPIFFLQWIVCTFSVREVCEQIDDWWSRRSSGHVSAVQIIQRVG